MSLGSAIMGEVIDSGVSNQPLDEKTIVMLSDFENSSGGSSHVILKNKNRLIIIY